MKDKFIAWHNVDGSVDELQKTRLEYEVGDIINVNHHGNQYKCIEVCIYDDKIVYHFKQGKRIYTFDY